MSEIDNNCNNIDKYDDLFYRVFHNIVLFRLIFKHVRLYNKNKEKTFYELKSLRNYQEKEYIEKIVYHGLHSGKEEFIIGDFPNNSNILKEIEINGCTIANGDIIPNGIEILTLSQSMNVISQHKFIITPPLSTLPNTIHTINNVVITEDKYLSRDKKCPIEYNIIPSNIKSISFSSCFDISSDNGFSIPNTITSLNFNGRWSSWDNSSNLPLRINDIPNSITKLNLCQYNIKLLNNDVLPNSIKELSITLNESLNFKKIPDYQIGLFNFILKLDKLEILNIKCQNCILPSSNLNKCKTIKTMVIETLNYFPTPISPNSLPTSLTKLSLISVGELLFENENIIPKSVTNLKLILSDLHSSDKMKLPNSIKSLKLNRYISKLNVLPGSLTHLSFYYYFYYNSKCLTSMISILPKSLTSIKFPRSFINHKSYVDFTKLSDIKLPSNIKNITFTKKIY